LLKVSVTADLLVFFERLSGVVDVIWRFEKCSIVCKMPELQKAVKKAGWPELSPF
jgi:hypothetical protein